MGNVKGRVRQQLDRPIESNNNQSATNKYNNFCTTQLKITTDKFFWMFENFSGHDEKCGEYLQSTEFISKAPDGQLLKWEMRMYPNGRIEESNDYIAIFLYLTDSKNEEMEAKFQITIRKPNGDEFVLKPTEWRKYKPDTNGWGCDKMIKREDLLKAENGYLDGGQLTIVCSVTVKQKSVKNVWVPECRLQEDVSHLFETGKFSDCKIISDNGKKEFKVHKSILWCRSPVFRAMFQHRTTENNENCINIVDIKGDVIEKMLHFIYSGEEPIWWKEMAEDLLYAAEKYELIRLKFLCERQLVNSLENANALALLSLANLHRAEHLKTNAIDYIKMHLKEVMESEDWKTYADEQLKDQILKAIAK